MGKFEYFIFSFSKIRITFVLYIKKHFPVYYNGFKINFIIDYKQVGVIALFNTTFLYSEHIRGGFACHFNRIVKRNTEFHGSFDAVKQCCAAARNSAVGKARRAVL